MSPHMGEPKLGAPEGKGTTGLAFQPRFSLAMRSVGVACCGTQLWEFKEPEVTAWHVSWGNLTQVRPLLWGALQITLFPVFPLLHLLPF